MQYTIGNIKEDDTPIILNYTGDATQDASHVSSWVKSNQHQFTNWLTTHGAVLLRGFPLNTPSDFANVVKSFGGDEILYKGGIVPRSRIQDGIYTSTELNRKFPIKIHQEMAYQREFPDRQLFFCDTPCENGGETPIADMRKVKAGVSPEVLEKLRTKGIKYVQVLHNRDVPRREAYKKMNPLYVHLTWQETFGTDNREEVNSICTRKGFDIVWRSNGDLELDIILPAFRQHPITGDELWFNHLAAQHFNKLALKTAIGDVVYHFRKKLYKSLSDHPNQVYYGDGETIPFSDMESIYEAIAQNTIVFPWQKGDLLIIDNLIMGHGRNVYKGERKILVSLQCHPEYKIPSMVA